MYRGRDATTTCGTGSAGAPLKEPVSVEEDSSLVVVEEVDGPSLSAGLANSKLGSFLRTTTSLVLTSVLGFVVGTITLSVGGLGVEGRAGGGRGVGASLSMTLVPSVAEGA